MTTREKFIVGVMCLTIVYGAYELLGNKTSRKKAPVSQANPMQELQGFVTDMTHKLVKEKVSGEDRYRVAQASGQWSKDPFIHSAQPLKTQLKAQTPQESRSKQLTIAPDFVFSGYLELGNTKMAVINGMEYAVGDSLGTNGYYVKNISSHRVVIGQVNGLETIKLPLREID